MLHKIPICIKEVLNLPQFLNYPHFFFILFPEVTEIEYSHNCQLMHLCKAGGVGFMGMLCNVAGLLWFQVNACNNGDCGYEENKISNI